MRGVIFKLKSEFKDEVVHILDEICNKKWGHTYNTIRNLKGETIDLNIYFLGWLQKTEDSYTTKFNFDDSISLPQYNGTEWVEDESKKAVEVAFYLIDYDSVNNYILLCGSKIICNKVMKVLNKIIYDKLGKNQSPFMYVNLNITNEKIDLMKIDKSISALNLMYVDETDDTVVKSSKFTSKKDKDLSETEEYKRIGQIADKYKTIKCLSPKFKRKVTFNEDGYFSSMLPDVQFKALVIFFIGEFEKVGIINKTEFNDMLIS